MNMNTNNHSQFRPTLRGVVSGLALAATLLIVSTPAMAQGRNPPTPPSAPDAPIYENDVRVFDGDQTISGQNYTLESGEIVQGDLTVFGGNALLKVGSRVEGGVTVFGGNAEIYGEVNGDVNVIGGNANLRSGARVGGTLSAVGGDVSREGGASTRGGTNEFNGIPPIAPVPPMMDGDDRGNTWNNKVDRWNNGAQNWADRWENSVFGKLGGIILITLFAVVLAHFLPVPIARMGDTIRNQGLLSSGVGLLTFIALPIAVAITIIGIITLPLVGIAMFFGALIGWTALAQLIGVWLMRGFGRSNWTLAGQAGAGAIVLAVLGALPVVGWFVSIVASCIGLGVLVLTRLGTQNYPQTAIQVYVPPQGPVSL